MIDTGRVLAMAIEAFEEVCGPRGYFLTFQYEATPAVFELTQHQLDESDPFAWPHHYSVVVALEMGYWRNKIVHSVVHDLPGAIRALTEGVELDVAPPALNDWMLMRLSS